MGSQNLELIDEFGQLLIKILKKCLFQHDNKGMTAVYVCAFYPGKSATGHLYKVSENNKHNPCTNCKDKLCTESYKLCGNSP